MAPICATLQMRKPPHDQPLPELAAPFNFFNYSIDLRINWRLIISSSSLFFPLFDKAPAMSNCKAISRLGMVTQHGKSTDSSGFSTLGSVWADFTVLVGAAAAVASRAAVGQPDDGNRIKSIEPRDTALGPAPSVARRPIRSMDARRKGVGAAHANGMLPPLPSTASSGSGLRACLLSSPFPADGFKATGYGAHVLWKANLKGEKCDA